MTINDFLTTTVRKLTKAGIDSARLDVELLLAYVLNKSREWVLTHDEIGLTVEQLSRLQQLVNRRLSGQPIAYLTRHKEFYGRTFIVTPDVLVPRPESEQIIDSVRDILNSQSNLASRQATASAKPGRIIRLADIGTGSGCLAITARLEFPNLNVTATDISPAALDIARRNADQLEAKLKFIQSDLLTNVGNAQFDIIIANLPYVDKSWRDTSPELASEPTLALYADDQGLALMKQLIVQAPTHLTPNGHLILEMDRRQIDTMSTFAINYGFRVINKKPFTLVLQLAK